MTLVRGGKPRYCPRLDFLLTRKEKLAKDSPPSFLEKCFQFQLLNEGTHVATRVAKSECNSLSVMRRMAETKKHVDCFLIVQVTRRQCAFSMGLFWLYLEEIILHCYALQKASRHPMQWTVF